MKYDSPAYLKPIDLGKGRVARNRVVLPPMASSTADASGFATTETLAHYGRLSRSNAGLMMAEYSFVHPSGRSEPNQLGIHTDLNLPGLREIAEVFHRAGALAGVQLVHGGGKTSRELTGGFLMAPSAIIVPAKDRELEVPDAMTLAELELWKQAFTEAAARARRAGFDLVELHAAHGYGLNQWLSGLTNQRQDAYGGSLANRARLLFEIVEAIAARVPELLLAVRMPGKDFLPGGLEPEDCAWIAQELVRRGVDVIDISSGVGGWRRPRDRVGEGYLVSEAAYIQQRVKAPVIGVGGIESGDYLERALGQRWISLAAVGRAILKDPAAWAERWMGTPAPEAEARVSSAVHLP